MKVHRIIAIAAAAALTIPTYSSAAENEPKHKIVGYLPDWNLSVNALEYESFVYDFINEKIIITNYTGVTEGTITIPNKIEGKEVLEIGEKAFYGLLNKNSTVVISDNISIINDYAFTGLIGIGMNAIYIPESIEYIGKYSIGYTYYPNSNMQNGCVDDQYKAYPVKIYGYPGTVAETHAKDNGFAFITLNDDFILGDINADGSFNVSDIVLMQKWLLAVPDTELQNWKAGDLCEDGILDVFDFCLMRKYLTKEML